MTKESEIVRALRHTCDGCNPTPCCEFEALGPEAADLIESLQAQLAASQRRADAAVEDINSVRMCHTCKHFLREFGMGGIECKIPCATIRCENFEWRGPQEAGKGE